MLFKQVNIIDEINDFCISKKNIAFEDSNSQIYFNGNLIENENSGFFFYEDSFCCYTNENTTEFFDINGKAIYNMDIVFKPTTLYENNFISSKNIFKNENGRWVSDLFKFQFEPFEELEKLNYTIEGSFHRINDFLLQINTKQVQLNFVKNGCEIWRLDLQSIPNNPHDDNYDKEADWEVKKFIGVLENKIWVALNHHTIIALDIENGELVHQIHDIANFNSGWLPSAIPLSEATTLDEKNNKLIGFMWEFYWEINPQNGEITLLDFTKEFLAQKIRNDLANFVLTDTHIYFASHHDIKVAAFNRQSKQIDWFHEFEDDGNGYQSRISKIDGDNEKLGVLTQGKVLYIFEKDS